MKPPLHRDHRSTTRYSLAQIAHWFPTLISVNRRMPSYLLSVLTCAHGWPLFPVSQTDR